MVGSEGSGAIVGGDCGWGDSTAHLATLPAPYYVLLVATRKGLRTQNSAF